MALSKTTDVRFWRPKSIRFKHLKDNIVYYIIPFEVKGFYIPVCSDIYNLLFQGDDNHVVHVYSPLNLTTTKSHAKVSGGHNYVNPFSAMGVYKRSGFDQLFTTEIYICCKSREKANLSIILTYS